MFSSPAFDAWRYQFVAKRSSSEKPKLAWYVPLAASQLYLPPICAVTKSSFWNWLPTVLTKP